MVNESQEGWIPEDIWKEVLASCFIGTVEIFIVDLKRRLVLLGLSKVGVHAGQWSLVGERMQPKMGDRNRRHTAARHLQDHFDIDIEPADLDASDAVVTTSAENGPHYVTLITVYRCDINGGLRLATHKKYDEVAWFPVDEALNGKKLSRHHKRCLREIWYQWMNRDDVI